MRTYNIFYAFLVFVIISCSKSDSSDPDSGVKKSVASDYSLVLQKDGLLTTQSLNANAEELSLNFSENSFTEKTVPELSSIHNSSFLQYHKIDNCTGVIAKHDFATDLFTEITVFEDLNDCELTATSLITSEDLIFISYFVQSENPKEYLIRILDTKTSAISFEDISLDKKPIDLAVANNKLFVLTIDDEVTDENSISIIDLSQNTVMHEIDLGYDAQRIFKDGNNDIIISYDELHSTLDSGTMSLTYTRYEDGNAPNFVNSSSNKLDAAGSLYYSADSGAFSMYPKIPMVYDFTKNLTTIYAFENFLTETKRSIEFELETATAVSYDQENNLILIGYKKSGNTNKGGLLRVKPAPDPAFVDNIDVDGVPYHIIVH